VGSIPKTGAERSKAAAEMMEAAQPLLEVDTCLEGRRPPCGTTRKGGSMRSVKRVFCVLACAASIGGTVVLARNAGAQTLPPSAACVAACAQGIGSCATAAAATLRECMAGCKTNHGRKRADCVQACAAAHTAAVSACTDAFKSCAAACPPA